MVSNKAANHFRWSGDGLPPPYFRLTSAPIDLPMMEKKVKEKVYTAATQFRADLQAVVTACKDGMDVEHPVRKAALCLMALAEQRLSKYGLGRIGDGGGKGWETISFPSAGSMQGPNSRAPQFFSIISSLYF